MLKRTERILISVLVFAVATLFYTLLDHVVNTTLYNYGLQFDNTWYILYSIGYLALYQIIIGALYLYSRSWRLAIVLEAFALSSGQDLVFFALWNGFVFPTGNWTWMSLYSMLGFWNTLIQVLYSFTAVAVASIVATYKKK